MPPIKMNNKNKYKKIPTRNNLLRCSPHSRENVTTISCYRNAISEYYIIFGYVCGF
jgi:hypothetical protein